MAEILIVILAVVVLLLGISLYWVCKILGHMVDAVVKEAKR